MDRKTPLWHAEMFFQEDYLVILRILGFQIAPQLVGKYIKSLDLFIENP